MTAATIDVNALDSLFDNQKRLDDVFSSIFDDDSTISSSSSFDDYSAKQSDFKSSLDIDINQDWSSDTLDTITIQKKQSIPFFVFPVIIEIAIFYYGIMHFIS